MSQEKEVRFKCEVVRCVYDSENFKVYAVSVDTNEYPEIKRSKYGTASICGEIHSLAEMQKYEVLATEENGKNGYSYRVKNIRRDKIGSALDMQLFLSEILVPRQAQTLFEVYPDIVQRVMDNNLVDVDLNKLHGIKAATFEKIKRKIVDNFCLVELVEEFQGLLSLPMLKRLYEKYPSIQVIRNKMRQSPYNCLCNLSGVGFVTADKLLLEIDKVSKENVKNGKPPILDFDYDLIDSKQRCLSCIFHLLGENQGNGHTKTDIVELRNQCLKLVPACSHHFVEAIKDDGIYFDKPSREVAIKATYKTEEYIAQSMLGGLQMSNEWECDTESYRNCIEGVTLSDEKLGGLVNLCKHNVSIINGAAGCGKTFATKAIIKLLDDYQKSYMLFSPTGRAAKVLNSYTDRLTSTIHRGLKYIPPDGWTFNKDMKLNTDVLIIDEVSMCDIFLFRRVIDAIDFSKTKLILIGDNAQLPSVSCGNLLHDLMESKMIPTATLNKVFRYSEGGLMKVATDVREMRKYLGSDVKDFAVFGDNKDYMFIQSASDKIVKNVIALYKKLLDQGYKPDDIMVLSAQNKGELGTVRLNNFIQKIANPNSLSEETCKMKVGETTYYNDDIVIQVKNNYKAKLAVEQDDIFDVEDGKARETFIANGETGRIVELGFHNAIIDFNGEKVKYTRENMADIKLGYSITAHKSQGGSAQVIIFITPSNHVFMLNSNIIYVGLTRTVKKCYHIGDAGVVNKALKKKENFDRKTFLGDLLKSIT